MSKAFIKEIEGDDEDPAESLNALPLGAKNYITPVAQALMKACDRDVVEIKTPDGVDELDVLKIKY